MVTARSGLVSYCPCKELIVRVESVAGERSARESVFLGHKGLCDRDHVQTPKASPVQANLQTREEAELLTDFS
jgi:hypothetical protein